MSMDSEYSITELHPIPPDKLSEAQKKAGTLMEIVISEAKKRFWSLMPAFQLLKPTPVVDQITHLATDGEHLFYSPSECIRLYKNKGSAALTRRYMSELLHIVVHGLSGHFDNEFEDKKLSWALKDLLVDRFIGDCFFPDDMSMPRKNGGAPGGGFGGGRGAGFTPPPPIPPFVRSASEDDLPFFRSPQETEMQKKLENRRRLSSLLEKGLGAYYVIVKQKKSREYILNEAGKKCRDNHRIWYQISEREKDSGSEQGKTGKSRKSRSDKWRQIAAELLGLDDASKAELDKLLKAFSKLTGCGGPGQGSGAGGEEEALEVRHRSRSDYTTTLKKLCREREAAREDPDTIDYMLYQYGMDLYGDMPIVEPVEENPQLQLEHIVLAIDTSGSCEGDVARLFIEETARMFENAAALAKPKKIHLVECDDKVQMVHEFKTVGEMREFLSGEITFHGYGGTSFVPVYDWILKYNKTHPADKVTALFYLTDGYGDFPDDSRAAKKDIKSYFILPEEDYENLIDQFDMRPWITPLEIKAPEEFFDDPDDFDYIDDDY